MTGLVGIVTGGRLTIYDMNGTGAVEMARVRVATSDPASILTLIQGLTPYLTTPARSAKAAARTTRPRAPQVPVSERGPIVVAYVTEHPGATTAELAAALGVSPKTGSTFVGSLRAAGLRGEKSPGRGRHGSWHWYVDETAT
jgi:hypothetical protein